jgi:hypothetical protein
MITLLGETICRDQLPQETTRPEKVGRLWQGVSHKDLADTLIHCLENQQIRVDEEKWSLDGRGTAMIGALGLTLPGLPDLPGQQYALGIRHSNDGRRAIQISCGTTVLVCHNGVLTGQFILHRRHTTGLDLNKEMGAGVCRYLAEVAKVKTTVEALQERPLSAAQADTALMEAGRRRLLPWSALGKVDAEYRAPRIEDFRAWHGRGWGLYNAFNEIAKQLNPFRQMDALAGFRKLVLS